MSLVTFTETMLRRDRAVVLVGLSTIVVLSWTYLIYLAGDMSSMKAMNMGDAGMAMEMAMPASPMFIAFMLDMSPAR